MGVYSVISVVDTGDTAVSKTRPNSLPTWGSYLRGKNENREKYIAFRIVVCAKEKNIKQQRAASSARSGEDDCKFIKVNEGACT